MTEQDLIKLGNRVIDNQGNVVYFNDSLIELLYNGIIPNNVLFPDNDEDIKLFNHYSYKNFDDEYFTLPKDLESLEQRKEEWFYPNHYNEINLEEYFDNLTKDLPDEYKSRVRLELQLYKEKGFEKFLRFCIYFSDIIKEKDLVIGVGRGSSVSSLILFLLKIHLIDPIKYGLNIKEFLK